ncbi:NitT/TauT family transport system substrate-binding protein [Nitratiruptor sp. YY08-14]|nr:NitT/TauT family transport system substrate-binding protein [Nitratiruptor sp. YY08-10]BCD64946.1 NitT/TauT family transport system substrate-binding protein [Nitratiruptor sp. YY08-14]
MGGCTTKPEKETVISANSWIGYLPIAYAYEEGWLEPMNIRLKWTNSLSESVVLCKSNLCDGFFATQFELLSQKELKNMYKPCFFVDISYGADKILSNVPLQQLYKLHDIDAYLEVSSVNQALLEAFVREHNLTLHLELIDGVQDGFIKEKFNRPSLVVTYEPYATILKKKGFIEVASSKTLHTVKIIDLFFSNLDKKYTEFIFRQFERAVSVLKKNPRKFYKVVKPYMDDGVTYQDFLASLKEVKWILHPSRELVEYIQRQGFDTKSLLL